MKLDITRKFGIVGGQHGIAKYEQDGNLFDAHYNPLNTDGLPLKKNSRPQAEVAETSDGAAADGASGNAETETAAAAKPAAKRGGKKADTAKPDAADEQIAASLAA